jgi:hypothetical protein
MASTSPHGGPKGGPDRPPPPDERRATLRPGGSQKTWLTQPEKSSMNEAMPLSGHEPPRKTWSNTQLSQGVGKNRKRAPTAESVVEKSFLIPGRSRRRSYCMCRQRHRRASRLPL